MVELAPGIFLTGEIPRRTHFELGDAEMVAVYDDGSEKQPDPLNDDFSLVVKTSKGLVVVLGCAHAGMVNIIDYVKDNFPGEKIYSVFGGTHMGFSGSKQFDETMKVIDRYEIEKLGVSHCTGLAKSAQIYARMPDRFFFACVGATLET